MPWKTKPKKNPENDPCVALTVYVPKWISDHLDDESVKQGLPKSRLICFALDHEMDRETPFQYPVEFPDTPYVEFAYAKEAEAVVNYLRAWRNGVGRDMVVLSRKDMGIEDRETLLLGYREAMMQDVVVEEDPSTASKFGHWLKGYKFAKLRSTRMKKGSVNDEA